MTLLNQLKEILEYHPDEGIFTYKVSRGNIRKGSRAGSKHHHGSWRILTTFNNKRMDIPEYKLVWLFETGIEHKGKFYHKNGDNNDNRFDNLCLFDPDIHDSHQKISASKREKFIMTKAPPVERYYSPFLDYEHVKRSEKARAKIFTHCRALI
jgi:hypothetical protein